MRRLTAEIRHASRRSSVVLAARHAAAPGPLPAGPAATVVAWAWPAFGQPSSPHHPGLVVQVATLHQFSLSGWVVALHLAAAVFGVGAGSLLVPPLIAAAGWRICLGSVLFLAVLVVPARLPRIPPRRPTTSLQLPAIRCCK